MYLVYFNSSIIISFDIVSISMNKGTAFFINLILILVVVSIFGFFGYYLMGNKTFVPENFNEARAKSSAIASELVGLLDESLKSLDKISEEDKNYRFSSAMDLVNGESEKIENAKARALDLSGELNKMAQAVQGIKPAKARNLALEAVSQEVLLISHIVNYNSYFGGLLETLRLKFAGDIRYDSNDVQVLVSNMNSEAKEINTINNFFNQKLGEFDEALN